MNVHEKVIKARMSLIQSDPFYASILLNMTIIPVDDPAKCPTFSVTSKELRYNTRFAEKLPIKTIKVVLNHEVLHIVFEHHLRGSKINNYDHELFNIAADLAINSYLFKYPGFPADALVPGRGDYKDMPFNKSAEFYYDILVKKKEEKKQQESEAAANDQSGQGNDSEDSSSGSNSQDSSDNSSDTSEEDEQEESGGSDSASGDGDDSEEDEQEESGGSDSASGDGDDSEEDEQEDNDEASSSSSEDSGDSEDGDDEENESVSTGTFGDFEVCSEEDESGELERIREMLVQAVATCEMAGSDIPGFIKEQIDELVGKPKVPWTIILRNALGSTKKCGINWRRPSRRNQTKFIMPSRNIPEPGEIWFVVDTSGSMEKDIIEMGLVECQTALDSVSKLRFLQFSTRICLDEMVDKTTDISKFTINGRGGTKFRSVVNYLNQSKVRPKTMVIVSDLLLEKREWEKELQGINVIWLSTTCLEASPGQTIHIIQD